MSHDSRYDYELRLTLWINVIHLWFTCDGHLQFVRWPQGAGSCLQLLNAPWGSCWMAALNWLTVCNCTTWSGSAFHALTMRWEKKCFLISSLGLGFSSLSECPRDCLLLIVKNVPGSVLLRPFIILNTSNSSALCLLFSSVINPVSFSLSS